MIATTHEERGRSLASSAEPPEAAHRARRAVHPGHRRCAQSQLLRGGIDIELLGRRDRSGVEPGTDADRCRDGHCCNVSHICRADGTAAVHDRCAGSDDRGGHHRQRSDRRCHAEPVAHPG